MTAVPRLLDLSESTEAVTTLLCDAFAEYPVMRYVAGDGGDYAARLRTLIEFFVANRVLHGGPIFTISDGPNLTGAALCTLPGAAAPPEALEGVRQKTWAALGADARERYDDCLRGWGPLGVDEPNVHLNILAVPPRYQGRGLGRVLAERVHALSLEHPESRGVTLTTEDPANVALYQHLGYRVVGRGQIAPGIQTWGLWRPDV